MDINEIKKILRKWAASKPLVARVSVFGSSAREDYRADSDIDIAVRLDLSAVQGVDDSGGLSTFMHEKRAWEEKLKALLPFEIDLERDGGADTPTIMKALQSSSIVVYQKRSTSETT